MVKRSERRCEGKEGRGRFKRIIVALSYGGAERFRQGTERGGADKGGNE